MTTHFILYVADQARSASFWSGVLERAPVLDVPGMTEFALGGDAVLGLMPEAGIRRLLGERLPDPARGSGVPRAELYLHVADPVAAHGRALAAGALELSAPALRDWGSIVGYSLDADGHVVAFAGPPPGEWIPGNPAVPSDRIEISTDPARLDVDAIHAYLRGSYWAKGIPREIVARSLANSLCFGLYDHGAQVGFARVVTDKATYAYLCDVYVLESHQGRGLGKRLMEAVMSHPDLQGLRRFALATRDAHGLYARYGFAPPVNPAGQMEIRVPDIYVKDAPPAAEGPWR